MIQWKRKLFIRIYHAVFIKPRGRIWVNIKKVGKNFSGLVLVLHSFGMRKKMIEFLALPSFHVQVTTSVFAVSAKVLLLIELIHFA